MSGLQTLSGLRKLPKISQSLQLWPKVVNMHPSCYHIEWVLLGYDTITKGVLLWFRLVNTHLPIQNLKAGIDFCHEKVGTIQNIVAFINELGVKL